MRYRALVLCLGLAAFAHPAAGQTFTQSITFGDSNVDSGFYKVLPSPGGGAAFNALWLAAVAAGAGKPTGSPGLMNSEALAAYFGLSGLPANQGGANFATSGAKNVLVNTGATGGFQQAIPTTVQIANFLAGNGGVANPNGLYLIHSGANDIAFAIGNQGMGPHPADPTAFVIGSANDLAASVAGLKAAGARTFVVPGQPFSFPGGAANADLRQLRFDYTQTLWWSLAAAGVNFIPADINAVRVAIRDNPAAFGFQFVDTNDDHTACVRPPGIGDAYALLCSSNPAAPSQYAAVPNPQQTRLFADAEGHLSIAGQQIMADYYYSLVVAPSQISFLPESAVKTRTRLVSNIELQIDASRVQGGTMTSWVTGDVSHLQMDNYPGFPDDPSTPVSVAVGAAIKVPGGLIVGAAVSQGRLNSDFSGGRGDYRQDEITASLYAGVQTLPFWATLIGTYGTLKYDTDRIAPIGITLQPNAGGTSGSNASVAAQAGLAVGGCIKQGPVAGLVWQRVEVGGFTEAGSFTNLTFGDQTRDSAIASIGWKLSGHCGMFRPFAQLSYSRELASTDRSVTATLTTVAAPSYSMPAVDLDKDWGMARLGANVVLGPNVTGLIALSSNFGQSDVTTYGVQIGFNVSF